MIVTCSLKHSTPLGPIVSEKNLPSDGLLKSYAPYTYTAIARINHHNVFLGAYCTYDLPGISGDRHVYNQGTVVTLTQE